MSDIDFMILVAEKVLYWAIPIFTLIYVRCIAKCLDVLAFRSHFAMKNATIDPIFPEVHELEEPKKGRGNTIPRTDEQRKAASERKKKEWAERKAQKEGRSA